MTDEQTAQSILMDSRIGNDRVALKRAIVAALEAARRSVTESARGSIIDCTGEVPVVRRVLGTLPLTEEGVVVGVGHYVFMDREDLKQGMLVALTGEHWIGQWMKLRKCYSTESAARAAMEGGTRG